MKVKGFRQEDTILHYLVCRWCRLHISYSTKSINDMKRAKKAAEYHNQHSCRYNPANKRCETCAHATPDSVNVICAVRNEKYNWGSAPHPCSGYKQKKKGDER